MNKFNLSLKLLLCIFVRVTGSSIPPKYVRISTVSLAPNRQILIYKYYLFPSQVLFSMVIFIMSQKFSIVLCQVFNLFHVMP